jgi:phosphoglycolate phosphatase
MIRLVVFDLDGTLVDSREDLAAATNDVLVDVGASPLPLDAVVRMVGDGARMLVARALETAGSDADVDRALEVFHARYAERLLDVTRPYPGIPEVLTTLAPQVALAVLTNKPLVPTERLLAAFGWSEAFGQVIGGDSPHGRKPDPAGLEAIMRNAGVAPGETLMVGDSKADVDVAHHAGTHMAFASWGFGHIRGDVAFRGQEHRLTTPEQLVDFTFHF